MTSANLQSLLRDPRLWRGAQSAPLRAQATGHAALDAALPGGGWPCGAVSEILHARPGVGELSLALPLLVRLMRAQRSVALIAPPCLPYAPALAAAGATPARMLIVNPKQDSDALWCAEQLLRARAGAVLLWCPQIDATALRRLQLAAETGDAITLLYRPIAALRETSVAALRLHVEYTQGTPMVDVLKCRGARPSQRYALTPMTTGINPMPLQEPVAMPGRVPRAMPQAPVRGSGRWTGMPPAHSASA